MCVLCVVLCCNMGMCVVVWVCVLYVVLCFEVGVCGMLCCVVV